MLSLCPFDISVGVWAFVIGLSQISSFFSYSKNIDLKVHYIPSLSNPADAESRRLTLQDSVLSPKAWEILQKTFGTHTIDLMSLDSNVMVNEEGNTLKQYTPYPMEHSDGVNLFAQDISVEPSAYVFPPFCLISAVLKFISEQKPISCTIVFPIPLPLPLWWPTLQSMSCEQLLLGKKGDRDIILGPSKLGFTPRMLTMDLHAAKIVF